MAMMKGGQLIAETLVHERVPYIFGICGHGNVGILDALYDVRDKIQLIMDLSIKIIKYRILR